jgi:hypothetical protein
MDPERVSAARKILDGGSAKVHKSTRSGFTLSAVFAAKEAGKRILCLAPTHRILNETIKKELPDITESVLPNCYCLKLQDMVKEDKFLAKLPLPLPNCEKCSDKYFCPVTQILGSDRQIITITYKKLEAVMLSKSSIAKEICQKLSSADIVLLDEAHTISLPTVVRVPAFHRVEIPPRFPTLSRIVFKFEDLNDEINEEIAEIKLDGDKGHWNRHLSRLVPNEDSPNFKLLVASMEELVGLAQSRHMLGISDEEVLIVRDIISLMSGQWIAITYLMENEEGKVYLTGNYWISIIALKEFLSSYVPNATHIYASGTMLEPYPGFFSELSGKEVQDVIFPDLRNTNSKMNIYPDTWGLGARNFNQKFDQIVGQIVEIFDKHPTERIYIVAPNARKADKLSDRLNEVLGKRAYGVDYYRSDKTLGVKNEARICIAVGMAEVPSNTYDHQARGKTEDDRWMDSQRLRLESVLAATWQTWSRVKDPEGKQESRVYCIGVRADQIRDVVTWGPGRRLELERFRPYRLPDGRMGRKPIFRVIVDKLIDPPKVYAEDRTSNRLDRHNAGEYIDRIGKIDIDIINSKFVDKMPINIYRQNVHKFGIYNNPSNDIEEDVTVATLFHLFATRTDYCAAQDRSGKGYSKYRFKRGAEDVLMILLVHLRGGNTFGFYQIYGDDMLNWVCFDIDDHNALRAPEEVKADVRKLLDVLKKYGIPFLLEASGSPNSYHVWIFLEPTRTYNAYKFSRQIEAEARIECEVFPKQKGITKKKRYGNLVKVPLGINRKSRTRSQFLDPATFEPYLGEVPVPEYVGLREVPYCEHESKKKRLKEGTRGKSRIPLPHYTGGDLCPCMRGLLDDKIPLDGGDGHTMRVAIAAEARNIGLPVEAAIDLFKDQGDFNQDTTRRYVEDIYSRGYSRFSCKKLQDQCGLLVSPYCSTCPVSQSDDDRVT